MTAIQLEFEKLERLEIGVEAPLAVAEQVQRLGARNVFVISSNTLSRRTREVAKIVDALGRKCAGLFDRCAEHSYLDNVLEIAAEARAVEADLFVTVGGGTPIDSAKIVQICLREQIDDLGSLRRYGLGLVEKKAALKARPPMVRQIVVPTTLSGAEFWDGGGGTDPQTRRKAMFMAPGTGPRAILFDAALTRQTPERLYLSSGIRAVDHAVEGICSPHVYPAISEMFQASLRLLSQGLRGTKDDPSNEELRSIAYQGVWLSADGRRQVSMGASHGLGYVLGAAFGVPHSLTSCVFLPAVLAWNAPILAEKDKLIARSVGGEPGQPASEAVKQLISDLGLPTRLRDVGIEEDRFGDIAKLALSVPPVQTNVRPIRSESDVMEILRLAA